MTETRNRITINNETVTASEAIQRLAATVTTLQTENGNLKL